MATARPLHRTLFALSALSALAAGCALLLGGCATPSANEPAGPAAKEEIVAVTASNQLLRFNAGQPQAVRERRPLQGLRAGDSVVGIDYRVARGELFALGASGQLYKVDVAQARATAVGTPAALPADPPVREWGFDFNPTVDRIRVVSDTGFNLRLHPDTGAVVDGDPATPGLQLDGRLAYAPGDVHFGKAPAVLAAGYTYNKTDDKVTTMYALDGALGVLVHQGSKEGATPVVSQNTGRLFTVGSLGIGAFEHATLDVSDLSNAAYAGVRRTAEKATRWYRLDLATGQARFVGTVGGGEPLVGAAIEP